MASGVSGTPSAANIAFVDNDITGENGIYMFGDYRIGERSENVLIEGNLIHDIRLTRARRAPALGYGDRGSWRTSRGMTIRKTRSRARMPPTTSSRRRQSHWVLPDRNTLPRADSSAAPITKTTRT